MLYRLNYRNEYLKKVSIIYFKDEEAISQGALSVLPMEKNKCGVWSIDIENHNGIIYKFISDCLYVLNDPYAEEYIEIDGQGIWSKITKVQTKNFKKNPSIKDLCICKDIDDKYNPIEITSIIKTTDTLMICRTEVVNIFENFLISMFWIDEAGCVFASIDELMMYDGRKERIVFTGVNIKDIVNTNVFQDGKHKVELYLNGIICSSIEFYIRKLLNYNNKLYTNHILSRKIEKFANRY